MTRSYVLVLVGACAVLGLTAAAPERQTPRNPALPGVIVYKTPT